MPRSRAIPAAADTRSCAWHELQPPMRMKLWLCFSRRGRAISIAFCGDRTAVATLCVVTAVCTIVALRNAAEQAGHLRYRRACSRECGRSRRSRPRSSHRRPSPRSSFTTSALIGIGSRGEHQRRIAAVVPAVHVGAAIEQQLHGFGASCAGRVAERCLTELRPRAGIRALLEQQLHGAGAAVAWRRPSAPSRLRRSLRRRVRPCRSAGASHRHRRAARPH